MRKSIALIVAVLFLLASSSWAVEELRPLGMTSANGGASKDIRMGNTCTTSAQGVFYCGVNSTHITFFTDNAITLDLLYPLASSDTGFPYASGGVWTVDSEATFLSRFGAGYDNTTYLRGDGTWSIPPGAGAGDGDMTMAVYDVAEDGVVDSAIATAITDDLIVNADINTSADIAGSKMLDNSVTAAKLYATGGTADNTTWFRGDGYWAAISATPGGSDKQLQFNDAGTFGYVDSAGYDNVAATVTLPALISPSFTAPQTASAGCLKLWEASGDGGSATGFCAPALTDNTFYTLPVADGTDGQLLKTNGALALSWVSAAATTAIPYAADPTTDDAGEIAIDTTGTPDQLRYYGEAEVVIDARRTENATFKTPASGDKAKFRKPYGMTVTSIGCVVDAATSVILDVQECNSSGASCTTILSGTSTCTTTYGAATVSDPAIAAGNFVFFSLGTVSATPGYLYVDFNYTVTKE